MHSNKKFYFFIIVAYIVGSVITYFLTLPEPEHDKPGTNYTCIEVYSANNLPNDWNTRYWRSDSGLWWEEAEAFAFQETEFSDICVFRP